MTSGKTTTSRAERIAAALAIAAALCFGTPAALAEPNPEWGVQQLMHDLGQVKRSQARFVERKYMKVLNAPLEFSGTLTYTAPGKLEKRTLKPKPESLIVDDDRLTIEGQGKRRSLRLQDYPVLWAFIASIRSTLNGDLGALERFYRVDLEGGPGKWQLYLVPRDAKMTAVISQIRIGGSRDRIDLIEVQEAQGDRSVMKVHEEAR